MASPATAGSNLRAQTQQASLNDPQKEVKQEEKQEVKQETKNRKWYMCRKVFTENEFECFAIIIEVVQELFVILVLKNME